LNVDEGMNGGVGHCRNCGLADVKDLGFIGELAPFFLKRVLNAEIKPLQSRHALRRVARRIYTLPHLIFGKSYGTGVFVEMQICLACSFIQVKHPFRDEDLSRLYADYRAPSYNQERIRFEPAYAAIADEVGQAEKEIVCRVDGLTAWLQGKIEPRDNFSMLDFGGSDGRFLPRMSGSKYVYEISNTRPMPGIVRIAAEADLATYSYIQIAHVLEHVSEPLKLLKHVAGFLQPQGYLYIEVPQDLLDREIAHLKGGRSAGRLPVHEHVNVYCASSIGRLVEAAGLIPSQVEAMPIDLGWTTGTNIRALCKSR
jgi:hypothetical protein